MSHGIGEDPAVARSTDFRAELQTTAQGLITANGDPEDAHYLCNPVETKIRYVVRGGGCQMGMMAAKSITVLRRVP